MRFKPERGGLLIGTVALVALATFVYIAVVFLADPQKADTVAEGVEEATETSGSATEPEQIEELENASLFNAYVAAGYPTAAEMPEALRQQFVEAYKDGKLYTSQTVTIDEDAARVSVLVLEPTSSDTEGCGIYGQRLCLVIHETKNSYEVRFLLLTDKQEGSPNFDHRKVVIDNMVNESYLDYILLRRLFGDAGYYEEEGFALRLSDGELTSIAVLEINEGQPINISNGQSKLSLVTEDAGTEVAGDITILLRKITVSDDSGELMTIEGAYNPSTEQAISVEYMSTFSMDEGDIYLVILGEGYYYKAATGDFILQTMP